MNQRLFSVLFLSCCIAMPAFAAKPLDTIKNVSLIKADKNDGDSFMVRTPVETPKGEELHLRLYYVDSPETISGTDDEWERIHEQQCHFGLEDHGTVMRFGKQAAEYVEQELSRPFTVHTAYVPALGRSATGRIYAFIETHDGRDLGHLLVEQGLARVHGTPHPAPDGTPSKKVKAELQGMHSIAILNRVGIWEATNVDRLRNIRKCLQGLIPPCDYPLDLNTASQECLEELDDIGKKLAKKIIDKRPYQSVDDLSDVVGIGLNTLEKNRFRVTVGTEPSNSTEQPE